MPLLLDLTGRRVLVVGGGSVGRRKTETVLAAGASVRLVCPDPPSWPLTPPIDWRAEPFHVTHLDGVALVFAAAPPAVNAVVTVEARARGLWVNSASEPASGTVLLPAVYRRGDLCAAFSTGGHAPRLAQRLRDQWAEQLDSLLVDWLTLLAELRREALHRLSDPCQRRELAERLAHPDWLDRLRRDGPAATREAMFQELEALAQRLSHPL